jgi:hypothetical protein
LLLRGWIQSRNHRCWLFCFCQNLTFGWRVIISRGDPCLLPRRRKTTSSDYLGVSRAKNVRSAFARLLISRGAFLTLTIGTIERLDSDGRHGITQIYVTWKSIAQAPSYTVLSDDSETRRIL